MKTLLDFFPIAAFFVAYFLPTPDIYRATIVLMITMVVQVTILWLMDQRRTSSSVGTSRHLSRMHLISALLVLVLGTATIVLKNDLFIKWKPTVVDWLFAAVFLGFLFFRGKSLIQGAAGESLTLPDRVWRNLNTAWVCFFFTLGVLNLLVVFNFSEAVWVNFKLFGSLILTFAFVIVQGLWIQRYIPKEEEPDAQATERES
jgi:intracellular septation protein